MLSVIKDVFMFKLFNLLRFNDLDCEYPLVLAVFVQFIDMGIRSPNLSYE